MNALAFVLKYVVRIFIIAYLVTTNWRFLDFMDYLNAPKFWPLYWATCVVVGIYMVIIEAVYCVLVLNHSKRIGGIPKGKRKIAFFLTGITIVTAINLIFLYFVLSTAEHSFISARYWRSGFVFFLLLFMAYEAWVWYNPRTTWGFWVMERWVTKVVHGIEQKAAPSSATYLEQAVAEDEMTITVDEVEAEIEENTERTQLFIEAVSVVLMEILFIISQREGVYIYLRSGQCLFTEAKLAMLFKEEQLTWFSEYRKGARVSLAHLVSALNEDGILDLNKLHLKAFREIWTKSAIELHGFLAPSPVYVDRIKQQIENKQQLDKVLLSNSIQLKSVIQT